MFTSAQNLAIVQTELDSVFYQEFEYDAAQPGIATANTAELFKPMNIDRKGYIEEVYAGSGLFDVIGETATVPVETPKVANKLTTYVKDFAKSIEISKDLFDDNMHGVWSKTVADLARVARITQDQNAFRVFREAFTTLLTADGAALVGTHTLIKGGTTSNAVTGALDPTNFNTAIVKLREQVNQAGIIMGNTPAYLVVPPALFVKATQITESALVADSANNNLNVFRSAYGIKVLTSPYMGAAAGGSDTAWFLLGRNHSITRLIRQGIQTALRSWEYSNNRTYMYQANFREEVYCPDYVAVVASPGT
jgi:hypothetical protein